MALEYFPLDLQKPINESIYSTFCYLIFYIIRLDLNKNEIHYMDMTQEDLNHSENLNNIQFTNFTKFIIMLLALIIVLIFPYGYHIDLGPGPNMLMAIVWDLSYTIPPEMNILTALEYFIYYFYRFVVLSALWKLLKGKKKGKTILLHALICELIPLSISLPGALFLNDDGENYIPIIISIPFLLIYCITIVFQAIHKEKLFTKTCK